MDESMSISRLEKAPKFCARGKHYSVLLGWLARLAQERFSVFSQRVQICQEHAFTIDIENLLNTCIMYVHLHTYVPVFRSYRFIYIRTCKYEHAHKHVHE